MNNSSTEKFIIMLFSLIVAIGFGLSYGNVNHNTYLLDGLIKINPEFISGDWLGHQTKHYHDEFSIILVLLDKLSIPLDYGLAFIELILRLFAIFIIYKFISLLTTKNRNIIFLIILSVITLEETISLGTSYIMSRNLQPSSFGGVFALAAIYFFVRGQYAISGIMMAIAGYMHTNFLLLGFVYLGLAHLLLGRAGLILRGAIQFSPMLIVLAIELPFLLSIASNENSEFSTFIFQEIRAPGHYVPAAFIWDFLSFTAWTILGFIGLYSLVINPDIKKRITSIFFSLLAILIASSLLTSNFIFIQKISQFFPWRFAPYFTLISQLLFVTYLINLFIENKSESKSSILIKYVSYIVACLIICRYYAYEYGITAANSLVLILLLSFLGIILTIRIKNIYKIKFDILDIIKPHYKFISYLILIASLAVHYKYNFLFLSTLVSTYPPTHEAELFQWTKTTPTGSIFLAPLELDNLRIHGERGVVVDWRSTPIDPDGLVEWYDRVQLVSGVKDLMYVEDAYAGYHQMPHNRLNQLHDIYKFDYAIIDKTKSSLYNSDENVFENDRYIVIEM